MKKITYIWGLALVGLMSCNKDNAIWLPTPPGNEAEQYYETSLVNNDSKDKGEQIINILSEDKPSANYTLTLPPNVTPMVEPAKEANNVAERYMAFKHMFPYSLQIMDNQYYTITTSKIENSSTQGSQYNVEVKINDYKSLPYGQYLLPVVIKAGSQTYTSLQYVSKWAECVPLSADNPKPTPPSYPNITWPMKMVAYVETNDWDIRNFANFVLQESRKPVFDYVVLFAANMNYDAVRGRRYVHFNDKLQPIINNPEIYIKPLQDRGIKVIIDILPNHQGVGYHNFQSYEDAKTFVEDVKYWTERLGVDGWDIDEEYADYHQLPHFPGSGSQSVFWYMQAYKDLMPDKLLTLYEYGISLNGTDNRGKTASDYIDFACSDYGVSYERYGIPKQRFAAKSVEANRSGLGMAGYAAEYNVRQQNGGLMFFNINTTGIKSGITSRQLSDATMDFYGENCTYEGAYFPGPREKQ